MLNQTMMRLKYFSRFHLTNRPKKHKYVLNNNEFYGKQGQDLFVLLMLKFKKNGTYVEVGSEDPVKNSNTYLLETNYSWNGVSFDISNEFANYFNWYRKNKCILGDATSAEYEKIFESMGLPSRIDYLQVDVDAQNDTLRVLEKIPLDKYRFSVITFEHDQYLFGNSVMEGSRRILSNHGYILYAQNVMTDGRNFEDWWIDSEIMEQLNGHNTTYTDCEAFDILEEMIKNDSLAKTAS